MVKYPLPRGKWFTKVARKTCHDDLCRSSTFVSHNIKASLRRIFDLKTTVNQFLLHAQKKEKKRKKKERKKFIHNRKKEKQRYSYNIYIGILLRFSRHANSEVQNQKPPSQVRFSLSSIIITITSYEPWNTEKHKTDRNPPITNHKPWPFELVEVNFCFLRGPLR